MVGQSVSHYRIVEKLGAGGMGVVYMARDTRLDRDVALKFLPADLTLDLNAKERFIQEARAASALQHQNICTIHDIEETGDGQIFICMDYYRGTTLREIMTRGKLSINESLRIAAQIARGLTRAHNQGIVHRDIKPENVIVTEDSLVKIMDFGLAKLRGASRLTRPQSMVGTLSYMSPEQAEGLEVDQRSDLFSLGIVLYEMVTGRRPFQGEHEAAIIYAVLNVTPEPLTKHAGGTSEALQRIIDRALARDPGKRYQRAGEMLADLEDLMATTSTRMPEHSRPGRRSPRRRTVLRVSGGLAVVLAIAAGWYFLATPLHTDDTALPAGAADTEWKNSLAVLPFRDFSSRRDQEYFCNGMTDAIIGRLAKIPELKIIATTSVMRYRNTDKDIKEIGRELNVANVLEGTLQREKNKIRLSAQLISTENGFHLWADSYDRDATRVFEIQDDISRVIAEALRVRLTARARETSTAGQPRNLETYEYQLKGMNLINTYIIHEREEDFEAALTMFTKAAEIEPGYASTYSGLAWAYQHHIEISGDQSPAALVVKYSELAFQKNPNSAEANTAMGWVFHLRGDEDRAFQRFRRGLDLNPNSMPINHVTGLFYSSIGLHYQSIRFLQRAVELDPFYLYALSTQAGRFRDVGEFGKAEKVYTKVLELAPHAATYLGAYAYLCIILKHLDQAAELLKKAEERKPDEPMVVRARALLYAARGEREKALSAMQPPDAMVYALLGMKDAAIASLHKHGGGAGHCSYLSLVSNPLYENLRTDPRFQEIVGREKGTYDDLVRRFGHL